MSVAVALAAFPAALSSDRWSRERAIALMGTVWSLATAAAAAARGYAVLTGLLSDRFGLTAALAAMPAVCAVAAGTFWYGSRYYVRDRDAGAVGAPGVRSVRPVGDK